MVDIGIVGRKPVMVDKKKKSDIDNGKYNISFGFQVELNLGG